MLAVELPLAGVEGKQTNKVRFIGSSSAAASHIKGPSKIVASTPGEVSDPETLLVSIRGGKVERDVRASHMEVHIGRRLEQWELEFFINEGKLEGVCRENSALAGAWIELQGCNEVSAIRLKELSLQFMEKEEVECGGGRNMPDTLALEQACLHDLAHIAAAMAPGEHAADFLLQMLEVTPVERGILIVSSADTAREDLFQSIESTVAFVNSALKKDR